MMTAALLYAMLSSPAVATTPDLEVVVTSDPFARWRDTRWRIDQQLVLPWPSVLYAARDAELGVVALDVRMVVGCDVGAERAQQSRDVSCVIEDAAVSAAPWRQSRDGEEIVEETASRLRGLQVNLRVGQDGRVRRVDVDAPTGIRRVNIQNENLRQIVERGFAGLDLELDVARLQPGTEWVERDPALLQMPTFRQASILTRPARGANGMGPVAGPLPSGPDATPLAQMLQPVRMRPAQRVGYAHAGLQGPADLGRGTLRHRADRHQGQLVVQSTGTGTVDLGIDRTMTFRGGASAVSVFSPRDLSLTERVWSVNLSPTASSALADGPAGWTYVHLGNLRRIPDGAPAQLGESRLVAPPHTETRELPLWPVL